MNFGPFNLPHKIASQLWILQRSSTFRFFFITFTITVTTQDFLNRVHQKQ